MMSTLYIKNRLSLVVHLFILLAFLVVPAAAQADENKFHNSYSGNTVYDEKTGLIWEKATAGPMTWQEAMDHAAYLNSISFEGCNDWRLPTKKELKKIVDHHFQPVINTSFFPDTAAAFYWSSSIYKKSEPLTKWCVSFQNGQQRRFDGGDSNNRFYVRAVNGGGSNCPGDKDGDGYTIYDGDCNDNNAGINPGAVETCGNGIDEDCSGGDLVCDGADIDDDGDGYTENGGDCDDTNAAINPAAVETCDGVDNNCSGGIDENLTRPTSCGVGQCAGNAGIETCANGGWENDTCDPFDRAVTEVCDGLDNDCDGIADNNLTAPLNDLQAGVCSGSTRVCNGTYGWDNDYSTVTGYEATEASCDGLDNDCNGFVDTGCDCIDGDFRPTSCGVGACSGNSGTETCTGGVWGDDTCDPLTDAGIETCNGTDDDCDGAVDEGFTDTDSDGIADCVDPDDDGDGDPDVTDCAPLNPAISHNAAEVCDDVDNDCDGAVDEGLSRGTTCGVGVCSVNTGTETCTAGVWGSDTCNPLAGAGTEICGDGLDNDCDGAVDEDCTVTSYYCDNDTDGFYDAAVDGSCQGAGCVPAGCQSTAGNDCNDLDAAVYPGASEVCDGKDNDCNAATADGSGVQGYGTSTTCGVGVCESNGVMDCTGSLPLVNTCAPGPADGTTELACSDGLDNDCDNSTDCADPDCDCTDNVRLDSGSYFGYIGNAYGGCHDSSLIEARAVSLPEDIDFNQNRYIFLIGGYDYDFLNCTGWTTIQGSMTVSRGAVEVENIAIEPPPAP